MNEASKIYIGPVAMFQCTRTRIGGNLKVLIKLSVVEAAKKSFVVILSDFVNITNTYESTYIL